MFVTNVLVETCTKHCSFTRFMNHKAVLNNLHYNLHTKSKRAKLNTNYYIRKGPIQITVIYDHLPCCKLGAKNDVLLNIRKGNSIAIIVILQAF